MSQFYPSYQVLKKENKLINKAIKENTIKQLARNLDWRELCVKDT